MGGKGVNESDLLKFYDSKIPEEIISESQLARWLNEMNQTFFVSFIWIEKML